MARGRLISKSLGSSRKYAELRPASGDLGEFAQSLYPLLVANTDDFGRLSGDAFTVKHAIFPTSPRSEQEFDAVLNAMATVGLVQRYRVDDVIVLQINKFDEHQPGLHKRTRPLFPDPSEDSGTFQPFPSEGKGSEEKRKERTRSLADASGVPERFHRFWEAYPRKVGKDAALKIWTRLKPTEDTTAKMLKAITEQTAGQQWRTENGRYIPHPSTWLNQGRWKDEVASINGIEQDEWASLPRASDQRAKWEAERG